MSLEPEVHIVKAEQAEPEGLSLAELIVIVAEEFWLDPVETIREAVALLNAPVNPPPSGVGARIVGQMIWRSYGDKIPKDSQLCDLEKMVNLMRD